MMTADERNKLIEDFRNEPVYATALVIQCAAGLLLIALIAVIGVHAGLRDESDTSTAAASVHETTSLAHSRALYEQRRTQFANRKPDSSLTSPSPMPASMRPGSSINDHAEVQMTPNY